MAVTSPSDVGAAFFAGAGVDVEEAGALIATVLGDASAPHAIIDAASASAGDLIDESYHS